MIHDMSCCDESGALGEIPVSYSMFVDTESLCYEMLPLPPCQHLLGLVGQYGVVSFDHDS